MDKFLTPHRLAFAEVCLLVSAVTFGQSPSGVTFLHAHAWLLDIVGSLYAGWRAADRIQKTNAGSPLSALNLSSGFAFTMPPSSSGTATTADPTQPATAGHTQTP